MATWLIVAYALGFGAFAGVAKLVEKQRTRPAKAYFGALMGGALGGLVMGLATAGTFTLAKTPVDEIALLMASVIGGYNGAARSIAFVHRRDTKPHDGEKINGD